ncbi:MAG TPA: FAD-binding oxidoreductase [Thermomicrobiales bacterium]|nr:FAD-binding oxidoreductase [Thermomicrobiales bacterium]
MATIETTRPGLTAQVIESLSASHRGELLQPGDPAYDDAREVHNGLIDRRPALIARCTGVADVISAVNVARDNNLVLSIRGGGHNVAGNAVNDGGIVIDLSRMRGVRVDLKAGTVRAEGGATWGDVDHETQMFGLAVPGGVVSSTGIGGLTLHGGLGWVRRKYGLSIDSLISVDIVTADGQLRTANSEENRDLFWAVRGAGSNFGVVTSFEFAMHPVGPMVALAATAYAPEDGPRVLAGWRGFMDAAPEEISGSAVFWCLPPADFIPAEMHHRPVLLVAALHTGAVDEGEAALVPLRHLAEPVLDMSGTVPYTELQSSFDPLFPKGWFYYWKSLYLNKLEEPEIAALTQIGANRPTPITAVALWHLGGQMTRTAASETAFGSREAPYLLSLDTTWNNEADTDRCIQWTRDTWRAAHAFSQGGLYLNFAGFGEEKEALVRASYGTNYDGLVDIKTRYDPTNLFRMNNNISPALK